MAWRSSGATNAELISNMRSSSLITSARVFEAMSRVDRAHYVADSSRAYQDSPQTIGYGATISAPHMHAYAAENLLPLLQPGAKVLDVGSGSGYTLAVFYRLVGERGKVVGIDHIKELVDMGCSNLKKDGLEEELADGTIVNVVGDGRKGWAEDAPFDAIHVGAAAKGVPQALLDQLKCPGRMFIPVEEDGGEQNIVQIDKAEDGQVTRRKICPVRYVPLTDAGLQWRK